MEREVRLLYLGGMVTGLGGLLVLGTTAALLMGVHQGLLPLLVDWALALVWMGGLLTLATLAWTYLKLTRPT